MERLYGYCDSDVLFLDKSDIPGASLNAKSPYKKRKVDACHREVSMEREAPTELTSGKDDFDDTYDEFEVVDFPGRNHMGGQYCCVSLCRSSSGQRLERMRLGMVRLSFHSFPDIKTDKGKQW